MSVEPVRVACLGLGWWSDVLADAAGRTPAIDIVACYTRSAAKREAFAKKYACKAAASYEDLLAQKDKLLDLSEYAVRGEGWSFDALDI